MSWYFYPFGRCENCNWPHHGKVDLPAKPKRWWRRQPRPAYSVVFCCNCGKKTDIRGEGT